MSSTMRSSTVIRSFAFKLTLTLAALFGLASAVSVLLVYFGVFMHLRSTVDAELSGDLQEFSHNMAITNYDVDALRSVFADETKEEGPDRKFCRIVSGLDEVIASSDTSSWPHPQLSSVSIVGQTGGETILTTIERDGNRRARVISGPVGAGRFLQIGMALDKDEEFLSDLRRMAAVILVGMLFLGTLIAWRMARKAMAGVQEVTRATERIANGHFDDRVTVTGYGEEIELLGATFNRMAEKIQLLLREMSQINNSIAHDLRSPITRIRVFSESIATEGNVSPRCEEATAGIVEDCDRLTNMIDTMLNIAEVEAGVTRLNMEEVAPEQVVSEALDLFQPVAEEKGIELHCEILPTPRIRVDRRKVQRCLANLVDNALKYTDPGGEIVVALKHENDDFVTIAVRDDGIGITAQERSRVFDRFYRGDRSRSRPGNGLGLSLALAVAHALGGDITVDSAPGVGSTFNLTLPAAAPEGHGLASNVPPS